MKGGQNRWNITHDDELCTQVPPSKIRMPAGLAMPPFEAATGSWLNRATVLASSYVVPPIMKMMTSCGLKDHELRCE